ncbi:MlaE family ABC transporter permease [Variovorax sp. VNK109]|uniref:MlaE family ABC transporter permease n=1 Tax=Variovorax sp. VNK109 TaxID=3400919 RepID=UPI003BFC3A0E
MASLPSLRPLADDAVRGPARWLASWGRLVVLAAMILVLVLTPSTWRREGRRQVARHIYASTAPSLLWFTLLVALVSLIIIRIVVATALNYGLSQYALEAVIRVLVLELLPLSAPVFVALRYSIPMADGLYARRQQQARQVSADARAAGDGVLEPGTAPALQSVATEFMPRAVAGVFACVMLVAISCVATLMLAYFTVYGFVLSGLPEYTRRVGQVFNASVSLIFTLKTIFFSLAVSLIPLTSSLYDASTRMSRSRVELHGIVRMFAVILLVEVASLVGNYS